MAIQTYTGIVSNMKITLIDGYLPHRNVLLYSAEKMAMEINALPEQAKHSVAKRPYNLDDLSNDSLFEWIAFNARKIYCRKRDMEDKSGYVWSEAWLLKPKQWADDYALKTRALKNNENKPSARRLLVTLQQGCCRGDQCLTNLVATTGLDVIPEKDYKSIKAFRKNAEHLLDDISLSFRAPCIIAEEKISEHGYDFIPFGN